MVLAVFADVLKDQVMTKPRQWPRDTATELLGEPVEQWIRRHRDSTARLTYGQLARILRVDYGLDVHVETVRLWDTTSSEAAC